MNSKQTETLNITPNQQVDEVYTFPHDDGRKLQVTISVLDENDFTIASTTLTDVSVTKNYITKVSGKLFKEISGEGTGDISIDLEFDPEWAGETEYEF